MARKYIRPQRNYDNIEHESVRRVADVEYNDLHDELSECYYEGKPFRDYGVLTKEQFDALHGLCFHHHAVAMWEEHAKQNAADTPKSVVTQARAKLALVRNQGKRATEVADAEGIHPLLASALDAETAITQAKAAGVEFRGHGKHNKVT